MELEAAQTDGRLARHPLKNIYKEIQSHQLLLSLITDLIQDYDASLKVSYVHSSSQAKPFCDNLGVDILLK